MIGRGDSPARLVRQRIREVGAERRFHVFISYARAPDSALATTLRRRLQRVGRGWWERRRLRVFLDTADLTASESLPGEIHDNLTGSAGLVVLASKDSARSKWVRFEVDTWHRASPRIAPIIVLTDGDIVWSDEHVDFDWTVTTALNRDAFGGVFPAEPLWANLRPQDTAGSGRIRSWLQRRRAVADTCFRIAATVLDLDRETLARRERRRQRREVMAAAGAVLLIAALAMASTIYASAARDQTRLRTAQQLADAAAANRGRVDVSLLLQGSAYAVAPERHGPDLLGQALTYPGLRRVLRMPPNLAVQTVDSIAFSPDARWLVGATSVTDRTGRRSPAVVFWPGDGEAPGLASAVPELAGAASSIAVRRDGRLLAVGDPQGRVVLLALKADTTTSGLPVLATSPAAVLMPTGSGYDEVRRLSFSPDGLRLAVSQESGTTTVWDVTAGTVVSSFPGRRTTYSPDGATIATITSIASRSEVTIRDAHSAAVIQTFDGDPVTTFEDIDFQPGGQLLGVVASNGPAGVWIADLATGALRRVSETLVGTAIAYGDRDTVVTDTGVVLTQAGAPSPLVLARPVGMAGRAVAVRPGSGVYALAGHWVDRTLSGAVVLLDAAATPLAGRGTASAAGGSRAVSPDGRTAAVVGADGSVHRISATTGELEGASLAAGVVAPTKLVFGARGNQLAGINGRQVTVWALAGGRARTVYLAVPGIPAQANDRGPSGLAFSPDESTLAVASPDGSVEVLATGGLERRARLNLGAVPADIAFSPDGGTLAIATSTSVQLWDTATWRQRQMLAVDHGWGGYLAATYVDTNQLATTDGQQLITWNPDTGETRPLANPARGSQPITHLTAHPGSAILVTATDSGDVGIWDLTTQRAVGPRILAPAPVSSLMLSGDGLTLTTTGAVTTQWNLNPRHWLEWICDVVRRNMDPEEWQAYGVGVQPHTCERWPR